MEIWTDPAFFFKFFYLFAYAEEPSNGMTQT